MWTKCLGFTPMALLSIGSVLMMCGCHKQLHHCGPHRSHKNMAEKIKKKLTKELDLTESQKSKLQEIHAELQEKHDEIHRSHRDKFNFILREIEKDTLDQVKLNRLFEEKHQCWEELHPFIIKKLAEFHATLTPDQRARLVKKIEEYHN